MAKSHMVGQSPELRQKKNLIVGWQTYIYRVSWVSLSMALEVPRPEVLHFADPGWTPIQHVRGNIVSPRDIIGHSFSMALKCHVNQVAFCRPRAPIDPSRVTFCSPGTSFELLRGDI